MVTAAGPSLKIRPIERIKIITVRKNVMFYYRLIVHFNLIQVRLDRFVRISPGYYRILRISYSGITLWLQQYSAYTYIDCQILFSVVKKIVVIVKRHCMYIQNTRYIYILYGNLQQIGIGVRVLVDSFWRLRRSRFEIASVSRIYIYFVYVNV